MLAILDICIHVGEDHEATAPKNHRAEKEVEAVIVVNVAAPAAETEKEDIKRDILRNVYTFCTNQIKTTWINFISTNTLWGVAPASDNSIL